MKTYLPFTGFSGSNYGDGVSPEDYADFETAFAEAYPAAFMDVFESLTGISITLKFLRLYRPREYNFENDRILAEISVEDVEKLLEEITEDMLSCTAKRLFTSYDGFISFYDPDWRNWPPDISDWDENQVYCLLLAFIEGSGKTEYAFEKGVVESGNLHEIAYQFNTDEEPAQ